MMMTQIKPKIATFLKAWPRATQLFFKRGGATLAAASSFYFVISIIPLLLLLLRLVGFFIGDIVATQAQFFVLAQHFFPNVSPEVIFKVKSMITGPLLGAKSFTFVNGFLLLLSSLSFFNAIWDGLFLMTGSKGYSKWKYLKGIFLVGITVFILSLTFVAIPIFLFLLKFVQEAPLVSFLWENLEPIRPLIDTLRSIKIEVNDIFSSSFFYAPIFLAYFSFLYRWFFSWKISLFDAFGGAFSFVVMFLLWKSLFWFYFIHVRENLIRNYGDYYTLVAALIWIYLVMCFFFFGAGLCYTLKILHKQGRREVDTLVD